MDKRTTVLTTVGALLFCSLCQADFKYSETSQMTGGAMVGMMKFVGHFSKDAKKAMEPTVTTIYVKANRMRREEPMGKVNIIDLDGRRMIVIDENQRTYSIMTFDQLRAAMEAARAQAAQQQAAHPNANQQAPNVKITPKVQVTPTGATRTIMNLPTKEMKMRLDLEMQSDDPRAQGQAVTTWFTTDSWMAPDVPGYDEVRKFNARMAQELNWVPGVLFGGGAGGGAGAGTGGMQISPAAMEEFRKQSTNLNGTPMLQYISMGMGANGATTANGGAQAQQSASQQQAGSQGSQQSRPSATDMMPQVAVAKALGGFFGKKKKQQQEQAQAQNASASTTPPAGASTPGSLMDMTVQVTALSGDSLPGSLFEIPAGYTQVQGNADQALGIPQKR